MGPWRPTLANCGDVNFTFEFSVWVDWTWLDNLSTFDFHRIGYHEARNVIPCKTFVKLFTEHFQHQ